MNHTIVNYILVIGGFQSFFLTALLFRKKEKALHDFIIGAWLVFLGLYILVFALSPEGFFLHHPWLIGFYISLLLFIGPFLYLYIKALTVDGFKPDLKILVHTIPFLVFALYLMIFFSPGKVFEHIEETEGSARIEFPFLFYLFLVITAISIPLYIFWAVRILRSHREKVAENFSSTEKRNLFWLRNLVVLLGITWGALVTIIFIHHVLHLFNDDFCINGLFISLAVFILGLGYFGLYQEAIFTSIAVLQPVRNKEVHIKYSGSSLKEEEIQKHLLALTEYMKSKKPYLNNQLTLYQLAEDVDILPHNLSRIINEHFHRNFFDFINLYRIDEFKGRIADPKYDNYTLLAIAFDCGFNSKSSFNRLFKEATGQTPSAYKKSNSGHSAKPTY